MSATTRREVRRGCRREEGDTDEGACAGAGHRIRGIVASGICSITDNTVRQLSNSAPNPVAGTSTSALIGIAFLSSTAPADFSPSGRGQVCARNVVHSLNSTNTQSLTTQYPQFFGITYNGSLPTSTNYTA
ncbi:MAG: hypothetical protein ACKOBV_01880, partial [Candidatus Kapaibacterium sp.]